jgi:hypothetical protein
MLLLFALFLGTQIVHAFVRDTWRNHASPTSRTRLSTGCADDNASARQLYGINCPDAAQVLYFSFPSRRLLISLPQAGLCNVSSSETDTIASFCPLSCAICTPTQAGGQCSDLDDDIFAIDHYGLSCAELFRSGMCGQFNQTDVAERCTIACGFCAAPLAIPCWEDQSASIELQLGLSCESIVEV